MIHNNRINCKNNNNSYYYYEKARLFNNVDEDAFSQRPDIFIRNPRGLGRQVIVDVAVTGVDGQSRTSDEATDRPL